MISYYKLTTDDVNSLNENCNSVELNNLVIGTDDKYFGCLAYDGEYRLIFVGWHDEQISGICLDISYDEYDQDELVFEFAKTIICLYPTFYFELIDIFNWYQSQRRGQLMKMGYEVVDRRLVNKLYDSDVYVLGLSPIMYIDSVDKIQFYSQIFAGCNTDIVKKYETKENRIYINMNKTNNLFKIGRSINPVRREKTLQGDDHTVHTIACWVAPEQIENELHTMYKSRNINGEWFRLSYVELMDIEQFMKCYNPISNVIVKNSISL